MSGRRLTPFLDDNYRIVEVNSANLFGDFVAPVRMKIRVEIVDQALAGLDERRFPFIPALAKAAPVVGVQVLANVKTAIA
jgi:hypothetical protein